MKLFNRIVALAIIFCLALEQTGFAQVASQMGVPNYLAGLLPTDRYRPVHLRSLSIDPVTHNYDLLLDKGDSNNLKDKQIEEITRRLLEYFKIGIALPNNMFWVNLRPDSDNDIIDPYLERTDMGKVLLAADVQLKKDVARFTSPDTKEGREYWNKLYAKAEELFGGDDVEIPTVTRPWIVPGEIIIKQSPNGAYIYKAVMKVCLEQDWLKPECVVRGKESTVIASPEGAKQSQEVSDHRIAQINEYSSQLIRELVIPQLTREVNSSKRYSELRQVFYSLVLAQWAKKRLAVSVERLADSKDLSGLTSRQPWSKQEYYNAYRASFERGEYNKEEQVRTQDGISIRRYFSGGFSGVVPEMKVLYDRDGGFAQTTPFDGRVIVDKTGIRPLAQDSGNKAVAEDINARLQELGDAQAKDGGSSADDPLVTPKVIEDLVRSVKGTTFDLYNRGFVAMIDKATGIPGKRGYTSGDAGKPKGYFRLAVRVYDSGYTFYYDMTDKQLDKFIDDLVSFENGHLARRLVVAMNQRYQFVSKAEMKRSRQEQIRRANNPKVTPALVSQLVTAIAGKTVLLPNRRLGEEIYLKVSIPGRVSYVSGHPGIGTSYCRLGFRDFDSGYTSCFDMSAEQFHGLIAELVSADPSTANEYVAFLEEKLLKKAKDGGTEDVQTSARDSASIRQGKEDNSQKFGGVDFRAMPIVVQTAGGAAGVIPQMSVAQLEKDWNGIVKQLRSGNVPYDRLKMYVAACAQNKEAREQFAQVTAYIHNILRLEEDAAYETDPRMADILAISG